MDRHGGSLAVEGKDARLILRIYLDFLNILIKGLFMLLNVLTLKM